MEKNPTIRITEIFRSVQGEGVGAGRPSVFVRLQGCSVGCVWCDTRYSWDPNRGEAMRLEQVLERVQDARHPHVVITGGEPLENPAFRPLVEGIKRLGLHIRGPKRGV